MAAMYRDKVKIDGSKEIRANVYVLSAATIVKNGGTYDKRTITVTISPSQTISIVKAGTVTWRGSDYVIEDDAVPIVALGRLDHWEITAIRTLAG